MIKPDQDSPKFTILPVSNKCVALVTDLKNPMNYVTYIKSLKNFKSSLTRQYTIGRALQEDLTKILKKLKRTSTMRIDAIPQMIHENGSATDASELYTPRKTIVVEPEDLLFTIKDHEVKDETPTFVFEQKVPNSNETQTQYLYLNPGFKGFLNFIWKHCEVIIYSRLKLNLLSQILKQIQLQCQNAAFSHIYGGNSCLNTKMISDDAAIIEEMRTMLENPENTTYCSNELFDDYIEVSVKLKNIEKIIKRRGAQSVIFLDNNLYSYINRMENLIPVPKFTGEGNDCSLFFLKFYLEEHLKGCPSIWNEILTYHDPR